MSFKDFKVMETIGKGSFASVYKVIRKSDQKIYALKRVKISKMSKKEIEDALNEIRFLASIRHKNIVGFLHAFLENNDSELCIIMEYCGCGDLAQKVERYKKKRCYIDEKLVWMYLIQGLKALEHLHAKGICHRDLKVANTFLGEDGSIKIGDMNVSKSLKKGHLQTQIGTPYYMSPEIWQNKAYDYKSDIWSLGCMIYEVCALRPPFLGDSFPQLKRAIILGRYSPIPRTYSAPLHAIIAKMLKLSPRDRPSAEQLLKSSEIVPKLGLDNTSTSFSNFSSKEQGAKQQMLSTIKIPGHLNRLKSVLPKPCYPDARPNSPSAWTVAEQKKNAAAERAAAAAAAKQPPAPPLPSVDSSNQESCKENAPPPRNGVLANANEAMKSAKDGKPVPPAPPAPPAPVLSAVEEYFARKAAAEAERASALESKAVPPAGSQRSQYSRPHHARQPNPPTAVPPSMRPQPSARPAAGARYNIRGHRVW